MKGALRRLDEQLSKAAFVARFDIAAYYDSMLRNVRRAQCAATDISPDQQGIIAEYGQLPRTRGTGRGRVTSGRL